MFKKDISSNKMCTNVSTPDLSTDQRIDSSLDELFQSAITPNELGNISHRYCSDSS